MSHLPIIKGYIQQSSCVFLLHIGFQHLMKSAVIVCNCHEIANFDEIITFQWQPSKRKSLNNKAFHHCWSWSHEQHQTVKKEKTVSAESYFSYFLQVSVQCDCGRRKERVVCTEATSSYQRSVWPFLYSAVLNCEYEVVETSFNLCSAGTLPSPWPANCLTCSSETPWTSARCSLKRRRSRLGKGGN